MSSNKLARGRWLLAAVASGLGLAFICLDAVAAQAEPPPPAAPSGSGPSTWFVDNSPGEGLVGYWKFDEVSGTHTLNSAALANQTDLQNGASITESFPTTMTVPDFDSVLLDGVNDHVTVSGTAQLDVAPNAFSLAVWAKRTTIGNYAPLYDSGSQTNKWWVFITDSSKGNKFGFGVRGIQEYTSTRAITDTGWHHLAVVKTNQAASNLAFYVDGLPQGVVTVTNVLTPSGAKRIGGLFDGGLLAQFAGNLDEVRLYNRALSAIEVNQLAAGRGCVAGGVSWAQAFEDLQCALDVASPGDEIWIAGGTYRPGTYRLGSYQLVDGVDLFGGFAGTETDPSQRPAFDPASPLTVLSGDAAGNDSPFSPGDQNENICAVLLAGSLIVPSSVSAALDGLAIQHGNATCDGALTIHSGAGLRQAGGGTLTLSNLLFRDNRAQTLGGGVLVSSGGAVNLDGVAFISNTAGLGGGLGLNSGHVTITASSFVSNTASQGGAMALRPGLGDASVSVATTDFIQNRAGIGGALDSDMGAGRLDLLFDHVTFESNQSTFFDGGAVRSHAVLSGVVVETYLNTDFIGNYAAADGGALAEAGTDLTIAGSTFTNNHSLSGSGGALASEGAVTVTGTTFLSNSVFTLGSGLGGALAVIGSLDMVNSSLIQNSVIGNSFSAFGAVPVGGGVYVSGTAAITGTLFLSNTANVFGSLDNVAAGGGLAALGSLSVTGGEFRANTARQGGGLQVFGSAEISHTLFQANSAGEGGGVFADGGLILANSRLIDNSAFGSFISFLPGRGGGLFVQNGDSAVQVAGNLFLGNQAVPFQFATPSGSAMSVDSAGALVTDNTIVGRVVTGSAVSVGGLTFLFNNVVTSHTVGIEHRTGTTTEDYNLFFGNTANRFGTIGGGSHSLSANPRFANPAADNFRLAASSPGVDAGDNTEVAPVVTTDLDNGPRFADTAAPDTGNGTVPIVDIGAYELDNSLLFLPLVRR